METPALSLISASLLTNVGEGPLALLFSRIKIIIILTFSLFHFLRELLPKMNLGTQEKACLSRNVLIQSMLATFFNA